MEIMLFDEQYIGESRVPHTGFSSGFAGVMALVHTVKCAPTLCRRSGIFSGWLANLLKFQKTDAKTVLTGMYSG